MKRGVTVIVLCLLCVSSQVQAGPTTPLYAAICLTATGVTSLITSAALSPIVDDMKHSATLHEGDASRKYLERASSLDSKRSTLQTIGIVQLGAAIVCGFLYAKDADKRPVTVTPVSDGSTHKLLAVIRL